MQCHYVIKSYKKTCQKQYISIQNYAISRVINHQLSVAYHHSFSFVALLTTMGNRDSNMSVIKRPIKLWQAHELVMYR